MFGSARWRLTLWFAVALAAILTITGIAVYLTARTALYDKVNGDLEGRAGREEAQLAVRLLALEQDTRPGSIPIGPAFTAGGYFYALALPDGQVLAGTDNVDPAGLAGQDALDAALENGDASTDTTSSEGESLRVYVVRLEAPRGQEFLLQVGRSIESEQEALRRLMLVLVGAGGVAVAMALAGGYLLAGRALRPIKAAVESQRAFIADASHEIRTPLAITRASAELLRRHPEQPVGENLDTVDDIISETDRLGRIVSQMLTLARADAGETALSVSEVSLDELAEEVARGMRVLADQRGLALETQLNGPVRLMGDSDRLREMVSILTDNAIKYTDAGGKVRLEVSRASGKAIVRVSDTGAGIPPEALAHVFDRFYRVDKARSREEGGAGLGLAIARWVAQAHGGSLRVESAPGKGSVFTAELPELKTPAVDGRSAPSPA